MYLHLGADCMVKNSEIIAIFNLRHPQSAIYSEYVERYRDRYKIIDVAEGDEYASVDEGHAVFIGYFCFNLEETRRCRFYGRRLLY